MDCNVGKTDKIIRIIAGVVIIAVGLIVGNWWGLIGLIPLLTGILGWCPAYLPLGINTCKNESADS